MNKRKIFIVFSFVIILSLVGLWMYFKPVLTADKRSGLQGDSAGMAIMNINNNGEDAGMSKDSHFEKKIYTCSMHPQVIREAPGKCPICGMQLIKKETEGSVIHEVSLHTLLQPTNSYVISNIPAITLSKKTEAIEITALGVTAYNTNEVGTISSRINGRIEKLYVRYRYQKIRKGERIMDIYSPQLLTDQQSLLFLLKNDPGNVSLISSAKQRLRLLGFPEVQMQQIINSGKASLTIPVYSNYSGHIHEALEAGMNNSSSASTEMTETISLTNRNLSLKEGMYIQKGQTIFSIYNPAKIWALLNIYSSDKPFIKAGNKVLIEPEGRPGEKINGTIHFIEPLFRQGSKTLTARVNISNQILALPVGIQLKATIYGKDVSASWLPRQAVVSLGFKKIVFVKTGNAFRAQQVETGLMHLDFIQITGGLTLNDSVAAKGQYLIDSESFIKVNK